MKKCKKCGAPLEGFLYKTIGRLMRIKPSEKDQEMCNKCEAGTGEVNETAKPASVEKVEAESAVSEAKPEEKNI
ncbi:MAG: hypothetical protein NTX00_03550 [Candidatus Parcubacteria bacterium]|nr:hypothetical protein [Candidatus Parcubacteria bacterium]